MSIAETLEREGQMTEQQAPTHRETPVQVPDGERQEGRGEQTSERPQDQAQQERTCAAARETTAQPDTQPEPCAGGQDGAQGANAAPDPASQPKVELGRRGEDAAVRYLVNNGFEISRAQLDLPVRRGGHHRARYGRHGLLHRGEDAAQRGGGISRGGHHGGEAAALRADRAFLHDGVPVGRRHLGALRRDSAVRQRRRDARHAAPPQGMLQ